MKKIISMFVLVGLFAFAVPTVASACTLYKLTCNGVSKGTVLVCEKADFQAWYEILC